MDGGGPCPWGFRGISDHGAVMGGEDDRAEPRRYCLTCEYPLHTVESSQCPECGRSFDANDSNTFAHVPTAPAVLWWRRWSLWFYIAVGVVYGLSGVFYSGAYRWFMYLGIIYGFGFAGLGILFWLKEQNRS